MGFPLPLKDYLAPLAREELFRDGFCVEFLGLHRRGLMKTISNWTENVDGFFNLLALEIWGRLFFFHQTVDDVTDANFACFLNESSLMAMIEVFNPVREKGGCLCHVRRYD